MAKKISWQDPNAQVKPKRFANLGPMFSHIFKIFLTCFFLLVTFYYLILPQIKVNYIFKTTTCSILSKKIVNYAPDPQVASYNPMFLVVYEVNNHAYTAWTYDILNELFTNPDARNTAMEQFSIGKYYKCWYNPANPHEVVLKRGWDRMSILFFILAIIVALSSIFTFYRWNRHRKQLKINENPRSP